MTLLPSGLLLGPVSEAQRREGEGGWREVVGAHTFTILVLCVVPPVSCCDPDGQTTSSEGLCIFQPALGE